MHPFLQIKDKSDQGKFLKVSRFRKDIRKTEPHKHNSYVELVYLSGGEGTHTIDHCCYQVQPPVIFLIRREQVHHWELTTEPDGFVMILKKAFLDQSLDGELKSLLTQLSSFPCLLVKDFHSIEQFFELLATETNVTVQEGLLKALLAKILDVSDPLSNSRNKDADLFEAFRELLSQNVGLRNSVGYYAEQLHTTPQNLNALCRKSLNVSASELLSEYIISEAKRLLLYTGNSVAEVAYLLGFKDASHFVKYFKRYTLNTPTTFRKQ
ncbi:helix-turn-helix domain-containing protein [Taibaiella soli]|uniref:AraC family transcriptional regulator n=1 Tax=Taibaiella soli TaxID=1649169 RepID=A0A2W2B5Z4_9BACT|nr:helix-turn-helix domain-containing protein [Taibaiella soli]PZF71629.1 AraC family transcriptional regulator [Taibaiella soli]